MNRKDQKDAGAESDRIFSRVGTAAQVLIASMQIWLLFRQNTIVKGQRRILARQTGILDGGLVESRRAAEAAIKSAETADRHLLLTQRADVLVAGIAIVNAVGQPMGPDTMIKVTFKNYGPTRASNVRLFTRLQYAEFASADPAPVLDCAITVGAGESQAASFGKLSACMSGETFNAIMAGDMPLKVVGVATYLDVFGRTHTTRSTASFRPDLTGFIANGDEAD